MARYTSAEVKGLAQTMRGDFAQLYKDARARYDVVDGRHGEAIVNALKAMQYPKIQPIVSREAEYAARKVVGVLGAPVYEVHIAPGDDKDQSRADNLEIVDANLFLRLNAGNKTRRAIHRHQAISPYAALVLQPNAYDKPKKRRDESPADYNARVDRWRERWAPFRLSVDDPLAWMFYEDGQLNVTICTGSYEVPVVDLVQAYGEYDREAYAAGDTDPDLLFQVWESQFEGVRAGYGIARDEGRAGFGSGLMVKVCVVDDGEHMAWYVATPSSITATRRKEWLPRDYVALSDMSDRAEGPNPFGIPCMIPVPGVFNPAASRPEDRYQPWLLPHIQSRYNEDLILSEWSSMAAERPVWAAPMPPEVLENVRSMQPEERAAFFRDFSEMRENRINPTFGDVTQLNAEVNQYMLQVWTAKHAEHSQYLPHSTWTGTEASQSTIKNTPASSLLRLDEIESQDFSQPQELEIDAWLKVFKAHDYYWTHTASEKDEARVRATGDEKRYGKETKRGTAVTMKPSDWDFAYERQLIAVDNRPSTVMQRLTVIQTREQMGLVTQEERITALGIEDATSYEEKLEIEELVRTLKQAKQAFALVASVTRTARTLGVDTSQYLLGAAEAGTAPTMGDMGGGTGMGGGGQPSTSGYQMNPPTRDAVPIQGGALA